MEFFHVLILTQQNSNQTFLMVDLDFSTSLTAILSGLSISLVLFFWWLCKRVKIKKTKNISSGAAKGSYSTSQKWGIVGIILLLLPILYTAMSYLAKGTLFLVFIIFNFIPLTGWIQIVIHTVAIASCYFMMFAGTYVFCEYIWPKKENNISKTV